MEKTKSFMRKHFAFPRFTIRTLWVIAYFEFQKSFTDVVLLLNEQHCRKRRHRHTKKCEWKLSKTNISLWQNSFFVIWPPIE